MLALTRYVLKGPYHAGSIVGLLAVLAMCVMPLAGVSLNTLMLAFMANFCAVALVGLIILTQGTGAGLKVIVGSALAVSLLAWVVLKSPQAGVSMALLQWLPVIVLGLVLRGTNSLAMTVLAGVAVGMMIVGLQHLYWTELESSWLMRLVPREQVDELTVEQRRQLGQAVRLLMLSSASILYLTSMMAVFAARWMQARLVESSGFRREFCDLKLGKPAALVAVLSIPAVLLLQQTWLVSFVLLAVMAFMFQGIAVVHSRLSDKKQGFAMLVLYYILLVFTFQITGVLTAITGVIDNWLGFRRSSRNPAA